MPAVVKAKLRGQEQLAANLRALEAEVRTRGMRSATGSGAGVIRKEVENRAPVDEGIIKSSVFVVRDKQQASSVREVFHIGVRSGGKKVWRSVFDPTTGRTSRAKVNARMTAPYWKWVEFGHFARHAGSSSRDNSVKRVLKRVAAGARWIAAKPFVRPALEAVRDQVVDVVRDRLAGLLRRVAAGFKKGIKP